MTPTTFDVAKQYHEAGSLLEAEALYRKALTEGPEAYKVYNNLGTLLEEQGRMDEALAAYQTGIQLAPDCFILHYNLGHALQRTEQLNEALLAYVCALNLEPDSFEAHFNVGNLLCDQGRFPSAVEAYLRALKSRPTSKEAYSNLGSAFFEQRRWEDALECYRRSIQLDPEAASEWFHLARTLEVIERREEAIEAYQRSLELGPASSATHAHLVLLYQSLEQHHEVEQAFAKWRMAVPGDPVADHMWAAYSGEAVPDRASDDYIRAVFDQFAGDFDAVLSRLNYRVPQLLVAQLAEHCLPVLDGTPPTRVLDAGCGTGLCGPLIRPYAGQLIGVDLSLGMLHKARTRGCYENLVEQELTRHLIDSVSSYDVIVCADTLVYFGDLREVLRAAYQALCESGLVLFSVELLDPADAAGDYAIRHHGRYAHAIEYVGLVLQRTGFQILTMQRATLRTEAARAVPGLIVVGRRDAPRE